jgi:K(+)-stimulated pyrophosphate-energized sodium pump
LGNTTAATGKGFAIGSAALTALALIASYIEVIRIEMVKAGQEVMDLGNGATVQTTHATLTDFMHYFDVTLLNPSVLVAMFIGAMVAFVFSGLTVQAVGRAAIMMVEEVRRQFKSDDGILKGTSEPDYERCVQISTIGAQREMILPALIAAAAPVGVSLSLVLGVSGVIGLLVGALATGFVLAVFLSNSGGAWDNAKKHIESGHHGGKNSRAHRASVIGDTVGDPFKDTSGPSLNILVKLMSIVAIVMAGVTVSFSLL